MWKRILAWQTKTQSGALPAVNADVTKRRLVLSEPHIEEILPTAVLAAEKAGVATQREFAKMMW